MTDPKLEKIIEKLERVKVDVAVAIGNIPLQPQIKSIIEAITALRSYTPPDSPIVRALKEDAEIELLCGNGRMGWDGKQWIVEGDWVGQNLGVISDVLLAHTSDEQAAVTALLGEGEIKS